MTQTMAPRARRVALLLLALATLAVSLVACEAPSGTSPSSSQGGGGVTLVGGNSVSPTPTFPPFTIGAYPSDRSPAVNDTITIYVQCRVQNQSMTGPSTPPPPGQKITINVLDPINLSYTATTGPDGIAAVSVTFNDPKPGYPVVVQVSTTWNNKTYNNETFFTPGVTYKPTATPKSGGATPTPTTGP